MLIKFNTNGANLESLSLVILYFFLYTLKLWNVKIKLKTSQFVQVKEQVKLVSDRCPTCKKPRKRIVSGVEIITKPEERQNLISSLHKSNAEIIPIDIFSTNETSMQTKLNQKKAILLNVSETGMILGTEIKYKRIDQKCLILLLLSCMGLSPYILAFSNSS